MRVSRWLHGEHSLPQFGHKTEVLKESAQGVLPWGALVCARPTGGGLFSPLVGWRAQRWAFVCSVGIVFCSVHLPLPGG